MNNKRLREKIHHAYDDKFDKNHLLNMIFSDFLLVYCHKINFVFLTSIFFRYDLNINFTSMEDCKCFFYCYLIHIKILNHANNIKQKNSTKELLQFQLR